MTGSERGGRPRLTYSNVVSTLALVVALGGTGAYAADRLGSGDIAKNAIRSKHIKAGQVKKSDLSRRVTGCPSGMLNIGGTVCIDREPRGQGNWSAAFNACADAKLRLPSPGEAYLANGAGLNSDFIWVDIVFRHDGTSQLAESNVELADTGGFFGGGGGSRPIICATPPGTR